MHIDRFTKVVLTIIAIALSVLAMTEVYKVLVPTEAYAKKQASDKPAKVTICDVTGDFCAAVDETSRLFIK